MKSQEEMAKDRKLHRIKIKLENLAEIIDAIDDRQIIMDLKAGMAALFDEFK